MSKLVRATRQGLFGPGEVVRQPRQTRRLSPSPWTAPPSHKPPAPSAPRTPTRDPAELYPWGNPWSNPPVWRSASGPCVECFLPYDRLTPERRHGWYSVLRRGCLSGQSPYKTPLCVNHRPSLWLDTGERGLYFTDSEAGLYISATMPHPERFWYLQRSAVNGMLNGLSIVLPDDGVRFIDHEDHCVREYLWIPAMPEISVLCCGTQPAWTIHTVAVYL